MSEQTNRTIDVSLFRALVEGVGATAPVFQASKVTLVDLSHTIEDCVLDNKLPSVVFTGFQESSHWREETQRYLDLAGIASQICIFAGGNPPVPEEKHIAVTLTGDDPLRQEWFLLVLTEHFSVVLAGQDNLAPTEFEADRTFTTLLSLHPTVVDRAVQAIMPTVTHYRPDRAAGLQQAVNDFPPRHPDGGYATTLITRIADHLERRTAHKRQQMRDMSRLQEALQRVISQLVVPVVPMFEGVIVVPVVGVFDTDRAQQVLESLLEGVGTHQADIVILDITGVGVVDTNVVNYLMQTARAAGLLGAKVILTGISAPVAQSIVGLGLDFGDVITSSNLQRGIQIALELRGLHIAPVGLGKRK